MFVMPHDPSTSLKPWKVGCDGAWSISKVPQLLTHRRRTTGIGPAVPRVSPKSPRATAHSESLAPDVSYGGATADWVIRNLEPPTAALARLTRATRYASVVSSRRIRRNLSLQIPVLWGADEPPDGAAADAATDAADAGDSAFASMPTSVEELRQLHGPRATWWGDLNAHEARRLYHELIPTQLLDENVCPRPAAAPSAHQR